MVRPRLITVLMFNHGVLFRTKRFTPDYRYTLNFVDAWSVDEIVVLDISRDRSYDKKPFFDEVEKFASNCFVPLSVGGGITSIDDIENLLSLGADKVVMNTAAYRDPKLIEKSANKFGSQCIVVSIDAIPAGTGEEKTYKVCVDCGRDHTNASPSEWARTAESCGAGEILIHSIERDGSLEGYDNFLNRDVKENINIPMLVSGGAGNWDHFVEGFAAGASAVCTSNIYHFTESSISSAKAHLSSHNVPIRMG